MCFASSKVEPRGRQMAGANVLGVLSEMMLGGGGSGGGGATMGRNFLAFAGGKGATIGGGGSTAAPAPTQTPTPTTSPTSPTSPTAPAPTGGGTTVGQPKPKTSYV